MLVIHSMNMLYQCSYVSHWCKKTLLSGEWKAFHFCVSASRHSRTQTALLFLIPAGARPGLELCFFLPAWSGGVWLRQCLTNVLILIKSPFTLLLLCIRFKGVGWHVFMEVEEFLYKYLSIFPEDKLKLVWVNTASWNPAH